MLLLVTFQLSKSAENFSEVYLACVGLGLPFGEPDTSAQGALADGVSDGLLGKQNKLKHKYMTIHV